MTQQRGAHSRWNGEDADEMQRLLTVGLDIFAVLFTDREGFITGWSEACWVITGFTADEVIGRPLAIIFRPRTSPARCMSMNCAARLRWAAWKTNAGT